jgi:hypothetical protein
MAGMGLLLFALLLVASQAQAVIVDTGNPDLDVRFDNTITYSLVYRLGDQDPALLTNNQNGDDGNRNFDKGLTMVRFDLLSEFDVVYNKFGVRFSGAGWNDSIYNKPNDNDSPATANALSVPYNHFTREANKLHGRGGELLEAFTFGAADLGDMTLRYRLGQFTEWWGDSFFLGWNAVAGGLLPVDVAKASNLPNTQLKELIRPVPQVSTTLQMTDNLSVGGYYQFRWQEGRLWASGSYWAPVDFVGPGGEQIWGAGFLKTPTIEPGDSGQFGLKAKYETMAATYGLYFNNFHHKDEPYVVTYPIDGTFALYYPADIQSYAGSLNFAWDQYTFSAEVAYRKNVPFKSADISVFPSFIPNMPHEIQHAKGDTLGITVNTFSGGMRGNFFCDSQDLIAELAYVKQVDVENEHLLLAGRDEDGLVGKVNYTPYWYQVYPGLDLTLPMSVVYGFNSKPTTVMWGGDVPHHGGSFNIGVGGTYEVVWQFELTYRNFFEDGDYLMYADRDYLSFYIRRAF